MSKAKPQDDRKIKLQRPWPDGYPKLLDRGM
jgi:hypothetical protein